MQENLNQYGYGFQVKVLTSMITDRDFTTQISDLIDLEYFDNNAMRWLIEKTLMYYNEYKILPTLDVFKVQISNLQENDILRTEVVKVLKESWNNIGSTDLPFIKERCVDFFKNQSLKAAILKSVDCLNRGEYDAIRTLIDNALKAGASGSIGHDYISEIEYRYSEQEELLNRIPTGWKVIDDLLGGGLPKGKMAAVMAPPGVGKTWVLSHIGANSVKLGRTVLHITLELDEIYVGKRYDSILSKYQMDDLKYHVDDLKSILSKLKSKLIIKHFPSGTLTVTGLHTYIEKLRSLGIVPDLVILDYAELMKLSQNKNQRSDEVISRLYVELRGLAGEFDFALWSADQTGREGSNQDVISGNLISNAFSKLFVLDFLMSLSRRIKDKVHKTARFHIPKNRYGPDGLTFPAKMDTDSGIIEIYHEESETGKKTKDKMPSDKQYERQYAEHQFNNLMNSIRKEPTDLF